MFITEEFWTASNLLQIFLFGHVLTSLGLRLFIGYPLEELSCIASYFEPLSTIAGSKICLDAIVFDCQGLIVG